MFKKKQKKDEAGSPRGFLEGACEQTRDPSCCRAPSFSLSVFHSCTLSLAAEWKTSHEASDASLETLKSELAAEWKASRDASEAALDAFKTDLAVESKASRVASDASLEAPKSDLEATVRKVRRAE